jgi:hypothetical protein
MRPSIRQGYGLLVSAALLIGILAPQARAEVNVNVIIGAPPPIIVHSAPTMLYLGEPAVYVAVGIPYDLFFVGGRYYYVRGNTWYWGPGYGGPWTTVVYRSLPPGLQKYRVTRLREFRDREYRAYRVSRPDYRSKHFVADYGPSKGKGKGQGRGRGNR